MSNRIIIYTNKLYTTNDNIIGNNSENTTNRNINDNVMFKIYLKIIKIV